VSNLLDQHVRVRDGRGDTPSAFQPGYLDPGGRVVSVGFRKIFF
jgi:hypothetical protein